MSKKCQFCNQEHVVSVMAKCNDLFHIESNDITLDYIPKEIGKMDYIEFEYCAVCDKIQEKY